MADFRNILLVYPHVPNTTYWSFTYALPFIRKKNTMPPLGLITVAGLIPSSFNLKLIDMNIEPLKIADITWADAVLISSMIVQKDSFEDVVAICNRLRKPVVAGGPYPTSSFQDIAGVDHFVLGEAEELVRPLLEELRQGRAQRIYRPDRRPDLTETVIPRFDLLNMNAYADMAVQYSRGCPFTCEFCDIWPVYGNRPRLKSVGNILAELDTLVRLGWEGSIFIVDDNFIGNKHRVKSELLPALREWQQRHRYVFQFFTEASINIAEDDDLLAGMRDAGFSEVFIGIETPSTKSLEEGGKRQNLRVDMEKAIQKIHQFGIGVMAGFILGFDNDTEEIFDRQISFIQRNGIPKAMVGLLTALPGTKLYERLCCEGRLLKKTIGNNTHTLSTNFRTRMNSKALREGYTRLLDTIYDYNLKNYFARCNKLLDSIGPSDHFQRAIHFKEVRTFFASLLRQPFTPYGYQYLKFLFRNLIKHRKTFAEAVTYGVIGHHFYTITQEMIKIDRITATLEDRYAFLRDQLNQVSQSVVGSSLEAIKPVQELWNQCNQVLLDLRRKIDTLHVDFRGDISTYYASASEEMIALFHQYKDRLDQCQCSRS